MSFANEKKSTVTVEWEVLLRTSKLKPLYEGAEYIKDETPMTSDDKRILSKATLEFDFNEKTIKDFAARLSLFKGIFGNKETNVQFAMRVHQTIAREFLYHDDRSDIKASEIVKAARGDSAGLNRVFVALLRLNEIPARLVYGRWLNGTADSVCHTISEFYVDGVGWVPSDPSEDVKNVHASWEDKPEVLLSHFGQSSGIFIAMSEDRNLVEIPIFGPRNDLNPNGFTYLFDYKSNAEEVWSVIAM